MPISPVHTLRQAMTNTMPRNAVPNVPNRDEVRLVSTVAPVSLVGSMVAMAPDTTPT